VLIGIQDTKREDKKAVVLMDSRKEMSFARRRTQIDLSNLGRQ
jgi:hypothetical protein